MLKVLLVGSGHMGQSLLKGWIKNNIKNIKIIDPRLAKKNKKLFGLKLYNSCDQIKDINSFNVIFFAVKPQIIKEVIQAYKNINIKNKLIISVIAGKNINFFNNHLGKNIKIIRTMPNLPASINKGVTCLYANKNVNKRQKQFAEKLFNVVGDTYWVKKEDYINKFTALSGSGPAYFYYFIECLTEAGKVLGIEKKRAYDIAEKTAIGSIDLLAKSNDSA